MDLGLNNRIILVTGASRGLGAACAEVLAEEGAIPVIVARNRERLKKKAHEIKNKTGREVYFIVCDLSSADDIKRLYREFFDRFDRIDGIIINAGGPPTGKCTEFEDDVWNSAFNTNFMAAVRLCREFIPVMEKARYGRILAVTSISAKNPLPDLVLSNSMRLGVIGYIRTLANEYGKYGIIANCILPGFTKTERLKDVIRNWALTENKTSEEIEKEKSAGIPLRRFAEPREFAVVAAFLISPINSYITGQAIAVDGGLANYPL